MKVMRAALALAGLGLVGALVMAPGAIAQTPPAKIGSSLVGKLEGPEIVLDAKAFPTTFKEAPTLAEQVKAGKLPAVDKRLPEPSQLFVVKPLREIGKYGGNWRGHSPGRPTTRTATGSTRSTRS
jgi:peptide/nickel transport system substrate-binding protein